MIREQNLTIKKLRKERDGFSFSRKETTRQWMDVLEDVQKEHEKEIKKLKKMVAELLDIVASLKNRNAELDEKRKMVEYRHNYLLFLHNPLVEPDNNLCERKARGSTESRLSCPIFPTP